mmetsp:Transcript_11985/g.17293  ORF Transcript_11985/g.17293 Transcript_11985/m.17293 type:complete len:915 (-) Transcript_11985:1399-4143(-)
MASTLTKAARSGGATTKSSSMTGTTRKIKIKPYSRPPSIPANFYDRTSSILLEATLAILRHEPLYCNDNAKDDGEDDGGTRTRPYSPTSSLSSPTNSSQQLLQKRPISREELYRSVEDLCIHKFGAKLYQQVTLAIHDAAFESLARLTLTAGAVIVDAGYIGFPSLPSSSSAESLLQSIQQIYREYTDYLFFVRSIFLYLDRSYVIPQGQQLHPPQQSAALQSQQQQGQQQQQRTRPLWEVGIDSLRRHMTTTTTQITVASAFIHSLLQLIQRDRDGQIVDRSLLRDAVRMLSELHLYQDFFLTPLLETSAAYYSNEGNRVMETTSASDISSFLKHVETRLDQCHESCVEYLEGVDTTTSTTTSTTTANVLPPSTPTKLEPPSSASRYHGTRKALLAVVENNLLKPHVDVILSPQNCFPLFQDKERTSDVRRMYVLLNRIGCQNQLNAAFYQYARNSGLEIVQQEKEDPQQKDVVAKLLQWKSDLDTALMEAFDSQEQFQATIRASVECVMNVRGHKMSEWLAKHVDEVLRGGASSRSKLGVDDSNIEAKLEDIMVLFRRLHAKDVFEKFHQRDLSKRLLQGKSSSIDLERSFLSKLKAECGTAYTSKMEGMFKDMELSKEIIAQYSDFVRDAAAKKAMLKSSGSGIRQSTVEMDVHVLTTGYWPQFPQPKSIKLPEELKAHVSKFESYYDNKYQGRRISWQYSLCTCVVKANFPGKQVDLTLTLYQALVLRCFNENDTLRIPQIMEQTGIGDRAEVERLLQSLSQGKVGTRVLIMKPAAATEGSSSPGINSSKKSISDFDEFCYNSGFTSKLNRLKIPSIVAKDTSANAGDDAAKLHEAASRDRAYLIDAAVVRIMKARKSLSHRDLVMEIMSQVKHVSKPSSTEIKKRIEGLMEREYLERNATDNTVYNYMA